MGNVTRAGGHRWYTGSEADCEAVADNFPRLPVLVDDTYEKAIAITFPDGTHRKISFIDGIPADATGTVDATTAIQAAIDNSPVGTVLTLRGTFRTTAMIVGRSGITLTIPKGSQVSVDHTGYAFHIKPGFSLLGEGTILHLQVSTGCLWMAPTAIATYGVNNCPIIGDLVLRASSYTAPSGIGIHWDMTLESGSFAKIGNVVLIGWDVAEGFTIPTGKYITSVLHESIVALYCRAFIDSTTHVGQLSAFSYNAIHVQPYKPTGGTQEYGIKLDNASFFVIRDLLCWDWDSTTPAPLEKIWLGSSTSDIDITTPSTRSYQVYNVGRNNTIRHGSTQSTTPAIYRHVNANGSNDCPAFSGQQDDCLALADKRYTVTLSGEVGGYTSATMFNGNPNNYTRFTGDGTLKSVEIDLGSAVKIHIIGVGSPYATAPSQVKISVYYDSAWHIVYDATTLEGLHIAHTGLYRNAVSKIKVEALKSSNFDITEIFAYSSTVIGQRFVQTNGQTYMYDDLTFAATAAGKGLSLIDLTAATRKRVFLDNSVLQVDGCGIGYSSGNGGVVTQSTSKSTGVTLNEFCGDLITHNETLNAGTTVSFVLTNSKIANTDHVVVSHMSSGSLASYVFAVTPGTGNATIYLRNITASNLSEALRLKFTVIKGATT